MSSRLRMFARWITATAVVAGYVALHLLVNVGMGQWVGGSRAGALWCGAVALALAGPALWLRHRRRSGVAELVGLVTRFTPPVPRWRRAVLLVNGLGYMLFAAGIVAVRSSERQGDKLSLEGQLLMLAGGLAALGCGLLILRRTRRHAAPGAAEILLSDGRRPVLYLRSFADDEVAAQVDDGAPINLHTREEQLAGALGSVGPVIAVGRPGEPLPLLGAARFYLPLDDWQGTVRRLMSLSQLIVLRLGHGDGLWWEVGQARATQPAGKLILLTPGNGADLVDRLNEHLVTSVPVGELTAGRHWVGAVVAFDNLWTPRVFPVGSGRKGLWARMAKAGLLGDQTPTADVARAVRTALAVGGYRRRTMVWRAQVATGKAGLIGLWLVGVIALPCWLGYRVLQLAGLW
ncbi:transferase [Kitasatospora sp. NPDC057518]|uniref:transferase n=1 Tax=Kitasatospora sp. NPDC057518 TaxID=3346155 RepID=UPI0036978B3D